jgi:hypothetical protein
MVRESGVNGVKAVLWYQGESDANVPSMTRTQYEGALLLLRKNLATDLGWPIKLVTAQIAYLHLDSSHETRSSVDAVRLAQTNAASTDANVLVGPVLYDLNISTEAGGDGVHIRKPEHALIEAARWWHMLHFYFYGGNEGRGPRCDSASINGNVIAVRFAGGTGSLRASGKIEPGWRVTDNSGTRTVISAVVRDNSTVLLTLDRAPLGRAEIAWASYNDAVGLALTDSSADAMPAEPCRLHSP